MYITERHDNNNIKNIYLKQIFQNICLETEFLPIIKPFFKKRKKKER